MADREYLPAGFRTTLGSKDLGLAEAAAESAVLELPTMSALRQTFGTAISRGMADHDWASIAEVLRKD
ncbi:NAD-binding protein [Streptomyces sp. NBC_00316]|uniref:NAD-binding protein n=1 Tax=Streptomyces sp. NBC_00316 TaxID=2975710 RepID=UPI002E298692|nr:NAD-binding protein [Streptomyces sp. NBC_00316]